MVCGLISWQVDSCLSAVSVLVLLQYKLPLTKCNPDLLTLVHRTSVAIYQEPLYVTPFTTNMSLHCFHGAESEQVNAWMADQGTQNNESFPLPIDVDANVTPDVPVHVHYLSHWNGRCGLYVRKVSEPSWLEEVCAFSLCRSALTTCLPACKHLRSWFVTYPTSMRNSKSTFPVRFYSCSLIWRCNLPCCSSTDTPGVYPQKDGYAISRSSDYIIYSVEAEFIERIVAQYGPCEYGFKCQLTSSCESECNRCWQDICQGPSPKFSLVIRYTGQL